MKQIGPAHKSVSGIGIDAKLKLEQILFMLFRVRGYVKLEKYNK